MLKLFFVLLIFVSKVFASQIDLQEFINKNNQVNFSSWSSLSGTIKSKIIQYKIESEVFSANSASILKEAILNLRFTNTEVNNLIEDLFTKNYILNLPYKFNMRGKQISFYTVAKIFLSKHKFEKFKTLYKSQADKLGKQFLKIIRNMIQSHSHNFYEPLIDIFTLISRGANIDFKDQKNNSPLIAATISGRADIVKMLIDMFANLNIKDAHGCTALMIASSNCNSEIVKMLIEANANLNLQNIVGNNALISAIMHSKVIKDCCYGFPEAVKMLVDSQANLNLKDIDGNTALICATCYNNARLVNFLLNAGANPRLQNNLGRTAYDYAVENGNSVIQKLLLTSCGSKL